MREGNSITIDVAKTSDGTFHKILSKAWLAFMGFSAEELKHTRKISLTLNFKPNKKMEWSKTAKQNDD